MIRKMEQKPLPENLPDSGIFLLEKDLSGQPIRIAMTIRKRIEESIMIERTIARSLVPAP